jgi:hypothetical protein
LSRIALFIVLMTAAASAAEPASTAFVFAGEPDPSGADETFLRLGRARQRPSQREQPARLEEEPRARLQRAIEAYVRMQLADGELVELFATRAAVRSAAGNEAGTWDDLLQVAAFSAARPLDPARFPPRVVDTERRAAATLAVSGKLRLSAAPADAVVLIDGLVLGRGAVEVVLPAGRHFVRAERAGFSSAGRSVEVGAAGLSLSLSLSARPAPPSELFTRAAAVLGARRVVGAWIGAHGEIAVLELAVVDGATGEVRARSQVEVARLTDSALAAAVESIAPAPTRSPPPRPWQRRPWVWIVAGGLTSAIALGVGLGVGLSGERAGGWSAHIDLRGAR